jgi:hypothetical protein
LICYFNQLTIYYCCMVIHSNRIKSNRLSLLFCKKQNNPDLEFDMSPIKKNLCDQIDKLSDTVETMPPKQFNRERKGNFVKINFFKILYKHLITNKMSKLIICGVYLLYLAVSIFNVVNIADNLSLPDLVAAQSYLKPYLIDFFSNFELSPLIMLVIDKPINYTNIQVEKQIQQFLAQARRIDGIDENFVFNWMDYFEYPLRQSRKNNSLLLELTSDIAPFSNDILVKPFNQTYEIVASRFYLKYKTQYFNSADARPMNKLRSLCKVSNLTVIPFAITFKNYEQLDAAVPDAYQTGWLTFECIYLVSLLFTPDIISNISMSLTFASICVGLLGSFPIIGLTLNPITLTNLFVSLVFIVNFSTYFMLPFLKNNAETQNDRAHSISNWTTATVASLALSFFIGLSLLFFASSYMFAALSKILLVLFFVGLLHAFVFVPVFLSVFGASTRIRPLSGK